ncbi:hypothetical protein [Aquimarina sp. MMG016]|uniref:hypothetical protein n=1 Tax=Aquimarina sp. MMG016 TaxID=2822690 RepID=UPI001B3A341C|nr:hypothetical protein [Aquimarina sp. MMG016]MBQ4821246.1 hypothetical protein [Aquimarina sp. MMG016]
MKQGRIKKVIGILLICIGAIALVTEIGTQTKNYYIQSVGIICLMLGLFWVNTTLASRSRIESKTYIEEEE